MNRPSRLSWCLSIVGLVASLLGTGCQSLVPFTHEIRTQHGLAKKDIENLQFYLSDEVVLRREHTSEGRQISGGHKLVVVSGKLIEEVVIPKGTPGIAVAIGDGSLAISFEQGSSLLFVAERRGDADPMPAAGFAAPPEPFPGNYPREPEPMVVARPAGYEGSYRLALDASGRVNYQGVSFQPVDDSVKARLLIPLKSIEQDEENRKVLKGVTLPGR